MLQAASRSNKAEGKKGVQTYLLERLAISSDLAAEATTIDREFRQILEPFLEIWKGNKSTFRELGFENKEARYLANMIKYIHKPSAKAMTTVLLDLVNNADNFFP